MAKMRNITDRELIAVANGHPRGGQLGLVQPDAVLEIDDDVWRAHEWPESVWAEVAVPADRDEFDPGGHTVPEVQDHLAGADNDEHERVVGLERDGSARKGIIGEDD